MAELDPTALSHLYRWIDTIPLDRPKRNIARDFSDGVLMSQVVHYFFPRIVELHNYSASNSIDQKNYNWKTLNQKVFKKMGFMISPLDIEAVVGCKKHAIERILLLIQAKIGEYQIVVAQEAAAAGIPQQQQQQDSPTAAAAPAQQQRRQQPQFHEAESKMQSPPQQQAAQPARKKQQQGGTVQDRAAPQRDGQPRSNAEQFQQQDRAAAAPARAAPGHAASAGGGGGGSALDSTVHDLRETIDILQLKVQKLEQLLRLKNSKIASLQQKLEAATGMPQQ